MSSNCTEAENSEKQNCQEQKSIEKTIYIGVFFDGTGNNKFQVMLGKLFRSKEAVDKYVKDTHGTKMSIGNVRDRGRKYWEEKKPTAFTKSQLDEIFFGYEGNEPYENRYFVEDSEHIADLVELREPIEDEAAREVKQQMDIYHKGRNEFKRLSDADAMSDEEWKNFKKKYQDTSMFSVQDTNYTNVAILESVFKTETDYYPVYVEGASTDSEMESGSLNPWAGTTGRGPSGVWDKIEKAAKAIARIAYKYTSNKEISKLTIKMSTYGFSRGATEARMFSFAYNPDNKNEGVDKVLSKIKCPDFLSHQKITKELNFVGVFDTVATVTNNDTDDLHLYGVDKADRVVHLCAMDEFRKKFPLTDISSAYGKGIELFLPGCHTDVGGGTSLGVDNWKQINNYNIVENPSKTTYKAGVALVDSIKNLSIAPLTEDLNDTFYLNKWNHNNSGDYAKATVEVLKEMGWIPETAIPSTLLGGRQSQDAAAEAYGAIYSNNISSVSIKKYVAPGYTNIPLLLMKKAVNKLSLMNKIPCSYDVRGKLLTDLYKEWSEMIEDDGQKFATMTNSQYHDLRAQYLHYSGDDVMGYELKDGVKHERIANNKQLITRLIYIGKKDYGNKFYFLSHLN